MELALTEEHMSCVTGMDQRLRLLSHLHNRSDTFKAAVFVSDKIIILCFFFYIYSPCSLIVNAFVHHL